MKKIAYLLTLVSGLALAAGSTVNPTIPVANSPLQSAPIRGNFAATASDINSLIQINAGATAPATPLLGQQWLNTTATPYVWNVFDGAVWDILGTLNASTNKFQAGSVPWSGVTGTPTTLSGYGITNGVSSVGVTMPSAFSCTGSPVTSSGTVACVFAAQSQAYFLASPAGATGTPLMRQIAATDIPTLNQNTTGNAATVTTNANLTGDVTSVGNATTIAPTGVTAGTYAQVTVNAKGQATAGVALNTVPFGGTGVASISGIIKGTGTTAFVTATAGTDYIAPGGAGGTPSSINLTNGTGLPISTGVSGLGTGVATGLGNAVTGSGSPVLAASPSISGPTITGSLTATGLVTLADHATQSANTVLGNATNATASPTALAMTSCSTSGSAVTWTANTGFGCNTSIAAASAGSVTVGTTTVGSGTTAYLLYNNGGTLGNEAASSVPFTTGTLSLAGNLATTGAFNWGFTVPGAYTYTLPGATTTLVGLGVAQTFTAAKTFTNSDLLLLGSSTGATTFTSANGSATNYTLTFPAATDTICTIAATQTLTGKSIAASEVNSGTLAAAQMPALTGDVTTSAGAVATTLATVNGNVGSFTNANLTVNAKGLVTAVSNGSGGGSGALTLISTQTASNSTSLQWTGLGSTYNSYLLIFRSLVPASSDDILFVQIGEGGTPTWETTTYTGSGTYEISSGGTTSTPLSWSQGGSGSASAGVNITESSSAGSSSWQAEGDGQIYIHNIPSTTKFVTMVGDVSFLGVTTLGSSSYQHGTIYGFYQGDNTTAKTAIRLIAASGNIVSGTASLYGISN